MRRALPISDILGGIAALSLVGLSCVGSNSAVQPVSPKESSALSWGEPLTIRWNQSIQDFSFQVSPSTEARSSLGEDGRVAYVYLEPGEDARAYQVTVTDAVSANGTKLQQPAIFNVDVAQRPHLVLDGERARLTDDDEIRVKWDQPMKAISYQVGSREGAWQLDERDPSIVWLKPGVLPQGAVAPINITDAVTQNGAPLAAPVTIEVQTPPALVLSFDPGNYIGRVPTSSKLLFTFNQPLRGGTPPEQWISYSPALSGRYEWLDDQSLRFVPDALPEDEVVNVAILGGMKGPRSTAGSYLEDESTALKFVTAPNKTIDVSLSRQTMTLYEGDREVRRLPVATGVRGADTPVGEFRVQYKMPQTRFVGINTVSRTRYDIPDVHWVMAFSGDYTIHGAYWRSNFGAPGSNGCVSLSDANAKIVYDFSPEGTFINIHD
jgi:hypothetical protein